MAQKKNREATDYGELTRELREKGPERLYLLWGEEDYLRESFFNELKSACVGNEDDSFNLHRLNGEGLNIQALALAVDSMPFMGERTLVELRNFPVNDFREEAVERLKDILSDVPDFSTVVLLLPTGSEPDGRLSLVRFLKKQGRSIEFTTQSQSMLTGWIKRRFAALGKDIGREACERLIFLSGQRMTGLIPEIEKLAGYAQGSEVTPSQVEELALHIPEAKVFEFTDRLAARRFDEAAALLSDLLESGEHPIKTLAMIGFQFRRLYTAKVALETGKGMDFVMSLHGLSPYAADRLTHSAGGFSMEALAHAVELCAESDYRMKSSSQDDEEILKELLLKLAAGSPR